MVSSTDNEIPFCDTFELLYVSGKLPTTYPSLKPTFCPKWELIFNAGLREG